MRVLELIREALSSDLPPEIKTILKHLLKFPRADKKIIYKRLAMRANPLVSSNNPEVKDGSQIDRVGLYGVKIPGGYITAVFAVTKDGKVFSSYPLPVKKRLEKFLDVDTDVYLEMLYGKTKNALYKNDISIEFAGDGPEDPTPPYGGWMVPYDLVLRNLDVGMFDEVLRNAEEYVLDKNEVRKAVESFLPGGKGRVDARDVGAGEVYVVVTLPLRGLDDFLVEFDVKKENTLIVVDGLKILDPSDTPMRVLGKFQLDKLDGLGPFSGSLLESALEGMKKLTNGVSASMRKSLKAARVGINSEYPMNRKTTFDFLLDHPMVERITVYKRSPLVVDVIPRDGNSVKGLLSSFNSMKVPGAKVSVSAKTGSVSSTVDLSLENIGIKIKTVGDLKTELPKLRDTFYGEVAKAIAATR